MENLYRSILLNAVSISLIASVIAFVYVTILTQPGHVLSWWKRFVWDAYGIVIKTQEQQEKYLWVLNPILECELCVSGQLALWLFIFTIPFNLIGIIFSICLSILLTKILSRLLA
ncbi:hypothetical protein DYBT9275_02774 [Dyadobacter sp. CECT 9275]|uniref:Uncharacterized protein n=1 Tax=Dyadobacter helix TaxID=2822344 RepID=A0A916JBF7_9BACT|nr:hypothetical protein DYBT9275_02774 [Dyadobacter sp. CECT 9275]